MMRKKIFKITKKVEFEFLKSAVFWSAVSAIAAACAAYFAFANTKIVKTIFLQESKPTILYSDENQITNCKKQNQDGSCKNLVIAFAFKNYGKEPSIVLKEKTKFHEDILMHNDILPPGESTYFFVGIHMNDYNTLASAMDDLFPIDYTILYESLISGERFKVEGEINCYVRLPSAGVVESGHYFCTNYPEKLISID